VYVVRFFLLYLKDNNIIQADLSPCALPPCEKAAKITVGMAVCSSTKERHGIVLTANYIAKKRGVKTGLANL
jgi:hypothetical protein